MRDLSWLLEVKKSGYDYLGKRLNKYFIGCFLAQRLVFIGLDGISQAQLCLRKQQRLYNIFTFR
ncbi:hypothetical protein [Campylobacter geochelonis]|uniref:hypothetical protein n=1 Tax=Campylobacter geochelonis TaxID=1780362 RepID=UPI001A97D36D|nr:hypothetical protein [Campylobacter geochelonis]